MDKIDVDATVKELASGTVPEWIQAHLRQYLESGGLEGHDFDATVAGGRAATPSLLLTTTGRRSGTQRTMPLFYGRDGNAFVVIGSKGGAETQPAWYWNILANSTVEIMVGPQRYRATARIVGGAERERLWQMMVDVYAQYTLYQGKTSREIPVVVIEPTGPI